MDSALIRDSTYILIAVSPAFRKRWEGTNPPNIGAGAAREAASIKAIFERDQAAFVRRVKVVILPGSSTDDVPDDLLGIAQRFTVRSFDAHGLSDLQLTLHGRAMHAKPALDPLPAGFVCEVQHGNTSEATGSQTVSREPGPQSSHDLSDDVAVLRARVLRIDSVLRSVQLDPEHNDAPWDRGWEELQRERSIVQASLDALARLTSLD